MRPTPRHRGMMAKTRTETDTFGPIEVPADRYWGAQTQRSHREFPHRHRAHAAAADPRARHRQARRRRGEPRRSACSTPSARARSCTAAQEVIDGKLDDHFPLVVWQTGSGTQTNMNVNEVIANRANEMLGGKLGAKSPVHPNDHVNMSQSSNDCFPTAMHIAAAEEIARLLDPGARASAGRAAEQEPRSSRASSRSAAPTRRTRRRSRSARNSPATPRRCKSGIVRNAAGAQAALSAGAGRHRGRHRPQCQAAIRRAVRKEGRRDHPAAVRQRAEQVRGAGLARRLCVRARRAQRARHRPVQDRQRHPAARLGAALRASAS